MNEKQFKIFETIRMYIATHGCSPNIRAISNILGYKSISTISVHIKNLIKNGYLTETLTSSKIRNLSIKRNYIKPSFTVPLSGMFYNANIFFNEIPEYCLLPQLFLPPDVNYLKHNFFVIKALDNSLKNFCINENSLLLFQKQDKNIKYSLSDIIIIKGFYNKLETYSIVKYTENISKPTIYSKLICSINLYN